MDLVLDERPDLMATLHESQKRYDPEVVPSFGQSIVYGVKPRPNIVDRVVENMNRARLSEQEHWSALHYPVETSSTEVIVDAIGCTGLCIETWMGFDEARRIEMHKAIVNHLLEEAGVGLA